MSDISPPMATALRALQTAVDVPRSPGSSLSGWRWNVRQQVPAVREALMGERGPLEVSSDDWLAARGGPAFRERNVLLGRLMEMSRLALESPDPDAVRTEVTRLVVDVTDHVRRLDGLGARPRPSPALD